MNEVDDSVLDKGNINIGKQVLGDNGGNKYYEINECSQVGKGSNVSKVGKSSNTADVLLEEDVKGVQDTGLGLHEIQIMVVKVSEENLNKDNKDDNANIGQDERWVDVEWLIENDE